MESYPHQYLNHNLPLVTLFGLETPPRAEGADEEAWYPQFHEHGATFSSNISPVSGSVADALRQAFADLDAHAAAWNNRPGPGKMGSMAFTYRNVGTTLTFPPHKASPPPQVELDDLPPAWQPVLHSPISPLTPSSSLYPDGILSPQWMSKHQCLVPSAVVSFFNLTVDTSRATLEDNALKTQINDLKNWMAEIKYATRLVVVLVCDEPAPVSAVVERLGNIRRSTSMDTKTVLYMPGGLSVDESRAYVGSLLSNLRPACIEYYRDLSKHARRKKNRANIPQPTLPPTSGTSQTLSARGWNVRYEVKLGVFAEFRGEMDAAERNYEQAYEDLMDGDIFEGISNWSPRFNEARMLADILAIRILRCLLWTNQTTSAAQSWANHKYRMQEVVDKRGKGSSTYAWQAWEATWSKIMAQLVERVEIPLFHVVKPSDDSPVVPSIYALPERTLTKDALVSPWDHLHHPGYWYARSAQRLQSRRMLASSIPAEDRRPPGESPASALASRSHLYDNYMVTDPHLEYAESIKVTGHHSTLILDAYNRAAVAAEDKQEIRAASRYRYNMAKELTNRGEFAKAALILKKLMENSVYVDEDWWALWQEILLLASEVAKLLHDGDLLLHADWQLQSAWLPMAHGTRPDPLISLRDLELATKPTLALKCHRTVPVVRCSFTFGEASACVGDPLRCQLILRSDLSETAGSITPAFVEILFSGSTSITAVRLEQDASAEKYIGALPGRPKRYQKIELEYTGSGAPLIGKADLSLDPGCFHVFEFNISPSEAQPLGINAIETTFQNSVFDLKLEQTVGEPNTSPVHWWAPSGASLFLRQPLYLDRFRTIDIKPRPPKLEVTFPETHGTCYTDEKTSVRIRTTNSESEQADVRLKVRLAHPNLEALVGWVDAKRESHALAGETGIMLPQRDLGSLEPDSSEDVVLSIENLSQMTDVAVEVEAVYTLTSKPNTIITKSVKQTLSFIRPFEANYETSIGIHPAPWPSYFELPTARNDSVGLAQRIYFTSTIACFAKDALLVENVELQQAEPKDPSVVWQAKVTGKDSALEVQPGQEMVRTFCANVQKYELDDRAIASVHIVLAITWRRKGSSLPSTTVIPAPPSAFDFSKPRALASAKIVSVEGGKTEDPVVCLSYMLENPSDFLLTFGVTMEASDQFAFAGPKTTSLQLTPFSRAEVKFTLLPLLRGAWIAPAVRVNDLGFRESLKVNAAEGVRAEKGKCLVWIPGIDDAAA